MAQREREKVKRQATRPAEAQAGIADAGPRPDVRLKAVERERDNLRSELAAAQARIVALEKIRDEAANRINWVIDSLQNSAPK
jgi:hypothetical protein